MELIKGRKSVRTYNKQRISDEDRETLTAFFEEAVNPYGIALEYRFLEPETYDLKSPVLNGETLYLAAKIKRVPHFEEAFGYSMEMVVLKAWELGIGTVWIGGTMNRENFQKAMDLQPDEVMPCITPVGYPEKKRSLKESMMRKGVKADSRLALSEIASEGAFGTPLSKESMDLYAEALEMVRWAPSAVNKQPWRILVQGNKVHFYEKQDRGYVREETGDLQKIDIGIAMYHFVYGMKKAGKEPVFCIEDPLVSIPSNWQYIATYTL